MCTSQPTMKIWNNFTEMCKSQLTMKIWNSFTEMYKKSTNHDDLEQFYWNV